MRRAAGVAFIFSLCMEAHGAVTLPEQRYKIRVEVPITFSDFIPDDNIPAPATNISNMPHCLASPCVYEGDNRDFSATANSFRTREKITLAPADPNEPLGFRPGTTARLVQPSALYDKGTSVGSDGKLTQAAKNDTVLNDGVMKIAEGTGDNSSMQVGTIRVGSGAMRANLSGDVSNPIPFFACNITWDLSVTVDRNVSPSISVTGSRGRYPAYDMSVGVQYLQLYDPRPLGRTAASLCLPMEAASLGEDLQ